MQDSRKSFNQLDRQVHVQSWSTTNFEAVIEPGFILAEALVIELQDDLGERLEIRHQEIYMDTHRRRRVNDFIILD